MGIALKERAESTIKDVRESFEKFDFASVVGKIWVLIAETDHYLSVCKPWAIAADETQRPRLNDNLYRAVQVLRLVLVLAYPVIPNGSEGIWKQLGEQGPLGNFQLDQLQWGGLKPGTRIGKPEGVFPRADKKETLERIETMENEIRNTGSTQPAAPSADSAPTAPIIAATGAVAAPVTPAKIGIEDFAKVELRAGIVKSAERIQGADKLLKLLVDIGDEVRQVLAGIALSYAPEDLVGRKVVIVTNLAPRKMRGLESNGMLLAASVGPDGKPVLCTFAEDVPAGAKVK